MINETNVKLFCKDDISLIENYDKAIADKEEVWHCHHRRETIYTKNGLIEIGEYYHRPAIELIFLTESVHRAIHAKLQSAKGENPMNGKHHPQEIKDKISKALRGRESPRKGKTLSEEHRRHLGESSKGRHWWNNGVESKFKNHCPGDGWVRGRL